MGRYGRVASIALLLLSGAGSATAAENVTTLTVWSGVRPSTENAWGAGMAAAVQLFEASHPGVVVTMEPNRTEVGNLGKLGVLSASGTPPDIAMVNRYLLVSVALQGFVQPLNQYLPSSPLVTSTSSPEHFPPGSWPEIHGFDGKVYGIPFLADNVGFWSLYYNRTHFQNAGINDEHAPLSWSEFAADARKLTHLDGSGKVTQLGYKPDALDIHNLTYANGGQFISDDGRRALISSEPVVEALQFAVDNVKDMGGWSAVAAAGASFRNGTASMRSHGEWYLGSLLPLQGLEYGVGFMPTPSGQNPASWIAGWSWAIPTNAPHAQLAAEFLDFAWSEQFASAFIQGAQKWADARGQALILPGALYFSYPELVRRYNVPSLLARDKEAAAVLEHFLVAGKQAYAVHSLWRTPIQDTVWGAVADAYNQAVVVGTEAPRSILQKTNAAIQAKLDEAWANVGGQ